MANERVTEAIVREHFRKYADLIIIEEQASENPKIEKLLQTASKQGTGRGKPEFIITVKGNSNLLIVVECKADVAKHESASRTEFAAYAVDGALLYASYLSKDYAVLAIAVSGVNKRQLKVSHFLQLKGEAVAAPILGDTLLPVSNYVERCTKGPEKLRQDYDELQSFTRHLNEELHSNKIPESQRSLLISCILIALENPAFKDSYKKQRTPRELAEDLVRKASDELKRASIDARKLDDLEIQFNLIKTHTSLTSKEGVLRNIIEEIDSNINTFIKTHEFVDVLGQLYTEFLRYANREKGLGIVLTPRHITELFADLAQVNKKSIVYDNCAGMGGFLISAMKRMVADAGEYSDDIESIKNKQIFGVEDQATIFALAVSNMYIHQDGKANIIKGDCFDEEIVRKIKERRPTVGFLNPPYKADKRNDTEELLFVLNNLECLTTGGTCVAIVPMQSALAISGKIFELKKQLMKSHTLEAVLSMPNELFFNSDIGVVSCVMVFTAHKPHLGNKETYLGYYKDDGFIKRKAKGRIDENNTWDEIKEKWVSCFLNRKSVPSFSLNRVVTPKDEWCAEAYMETDYSGLSNEDFIKEMRKYAAFKVMNNL